MFLYHLQKNLKFKIYIYIDCNPRAIFYKAFNLAKSLLVLFKSLKFKKIENTLFKRYRVLDEPPKGLNKHTVQMYRIILNLKPHCFNEKFYIFFTILLMEGVTFFLFSFQLLTLTKLKANFSINF